MADDVLATKRARVVFSSSEEFDQREITNDSTLSKYPEPGQQAVSTSSALAAGIRAGNINISDGATFDLALASETRQQELLAEFERRKKARAIAVPTDDAEIKSRLRQLGYTIGLFGEGPADRRERLRQLISEQANEELKWPKEEDRRLDEKESEEVWYHESSQALRQVRFWIAEYSLPKARDRLKAARIARARPNPEKASATQDLHQSLRTFNNHCSQVGDDRPIAVCRFSPDSKLLATGSWSGLCKLWSVPDCEQIRVLRGHDGHVGGIAFHPQATLTLDSSAACLASGATDGTIHLWSLESETPVSILDCETDRVARLAYHPSGRFIGAACFDCSWRLWDLSSEREVLHQEGHSRSVYSIAFQNDGALVASGGLDAMAYVWDLRTGKCIIPLEGHLKGVLTVAFAPDSYSLATGSEDHSVKLWDLRKHRCVYTVPAHTNLVSHVKFQSGQGKYLVTSSYDNTAKIWSHPGWSPLKTLAGHESKVMCIDISLDEKFIVTASYDRTFKLWAPNTK
ncbi:U4/U6 small nuclear ribonucleoprotein Prp4-like [Corticium candelabrum]|uniref:U4/U6 small nuclear ribonucleoprotein Prp4-like n=1 Tax=Corticium candelabrum TaxID=121492 RepID=UPI002E2558E6|nr:U4/U6 small nuclear ribonucleoprotein Prp4-like [Corticium candelabrum]